MATPKKKISPARRDMRRHAGAANKLKMPHVIECSKCNEPTRAHRVCSNCGYMSTQDRYAVNTNTETTTA